MAATDIGSVIRNSVDGYIALGKDIKGGYTAVATIAERNSIPSSNIIKGSLVYVAEENKLYIYNGTTWEVFAAGDITDLLNAEVLRAKTAENAIRADLTTKYIVDDTSGAKVCTLANNTAFIYSAELNPELEIKWPETYDVGFISEVTFRGSTAVLKTPVDVIFIHYGKKATMVDYSIHATIDLVFQYDGLCKYCYITEIED